MHDLLLIFTFFHELHFLENMTIYSKYTCIHFMNVLKLICLNKTKPTYMKISHMLHSMKLYHKYFAVEYTPTDRVIFILSIHIEIWKITSMLKYSYMLHNSLNMTHSMRGQNIYFYTMIDANI